VKAFTVVDHVALPCRGDGAPGILKLRERGEGRFVREIMLARLKYPQAKRASVAGDIGRGHADGLFVGKNFFD